MCFKSANENENELLRKKVKIDFCLTQCISRLN